MTRLLVSGAVLAVALTLAACGGGSSNPATPSAPGDTVAVKPVDGVGNVLVDSRGMALYSSDMDAKGKPGCAGACASIWKPLTVASGMPKAATGAGKVSVVMRSDGMRQVTVNGRPLYTFAQDSPGQVNGNGVSDAFSGRQFRWSAILAGGRSAPAGARGPSMSGGGGYSSGGGY